MKNAWGYKPKLYIIETIVEVALYDASSLEVSVDIAGDSGGDIELLTIVIMTAETPLLLGQVNNIPIQCPET